MFKAIWSIGKEDFEPIEALRRQVNVAGQGIDEAMEFDGMDDFAGHVYVCEEDGTPIAAGRMYPTGSAMLIDRIAVMPEYELMPYGELVLRMLLFKAQELPQKTIEILVEKRRFELVERFGFTLKENRGEKGLYACPADKVVWESACKHM